MNMENSSSETSEWLTDELKQEIRKVFEPRYKRQLTDIEILDIAGNLTGVVEEMLKLKWKEKYE